MVSKKLSIAVIVCLVLLLGAVGAYGYIENSSLQSRLDSLHEDISTLESYVSSLENETNRLQSEVSALENQVAALQSELAHKNSTKTFKFYWEGYIAEWFNVSTFWMNITMEKVTTDKIWLPTGENSTKVITTIEFNDLRDDWQDSYLGIASALTGSWEYFPNGYKQLCYLGDYNSNGQRFMEIYPLKIPEVSDHEFHHDEHGSKYVVPSEAIEMLIELGVTGSIMQMHIEYMHTVVVEFSYEMDVVL